jgi:hypothetical protein
MVAAIGENEFFSILSCATVRFLADFGIYFLRKAADF